MTSHPDRVHLLEFAEGDSTSDSEGVAEHVRQCSRCESAVSEYKRIISVLSDPAFRDAFDVIGAAVEADALTAEFDAVVAGREAARPVLRELSSFPPSAWTRWFEMHPECCTAAMAQEIGTLIDSEMNRHPETALHLADIEELIATACASDFESHSILGDAWKHRAVALRHVGQYVESLKAAEVAEAWYSSLASGSFDAEEARYVRAATLVKMTRYSDAAVILDGVISRLADFGVTLALAKSRTLRAVIFAEQGDIDQARLMFRDVLPMLKRFGDSIDHARVLANLAELELRTGNLDRAAADAQAAVERYSGLGMDAECVRSRWTLGMIHAASGDSEAGLSLLYEAAAEFEARGMAVDSAFVKLDICELLVQLSEWSDAEVIARELVTLFTAAGVTLARVTALDHLRRSVENRTATVDAVRSIRWLLEDDGSAASNASITRN